MLLSHSYWIPIYLISCRNSTDVLVNVNNLLNCDMEQIPVSKSCVAEDGIQETPLLSNRLPSCLQSAILKESMWDYVKKYVKNVKYVTNI